LSKAPSPLLGFNNNIRHKGRVFHVQTEDSGVRHPHVITHLFMDGGRILKTTKTSYAEHLNQEGMGEVVRKMMKEQHKAMFVALRNGDFDEIIIRHFGSVSPEDAPVVPPPPPSTASATVEQDPAPNPPSAPVVAGVAAMPAAPGALTAQAAPAFTTKNPSLPPAPPRPPSAPTLAASSAPAVPPSALAPRSPSPAPSLSARPSSPPPHPSARPAAPASTPPARPAPAPRGSTPPPPPSAPPASRSTPPQAPRSLSPSGMRVPFASDLPPPPANVLKTTRPEGGYREVRTEEAPPRESLRPAVDPRSSSRLPAARPRPASGRHPVARPVTGQRPPESGSLFGDDVNEKSLDEVILSYLAEDLDPPAGTGKK
jgi:hypothetical protein